MSSINNFKDLVKSKEFNTVMYDEYFFKEVANDGLNTRYLKRDNYKLSNLKNIDFPEILLNLVNGILDNLNITIFVEETYSKNNLNYYCNIKSDLEHYKFIEDIYYNVNLKCNDNNILEIESSIDKKYDENKINEIDKIFLNLFLIFMENNYTEYVKNNIFKKKLSKINLHSFALNIT
jgi:hypothetical protein